TPGRRTVRPKRVTCVARPPAEVVDARHKAPRHASTSIRRDFRHQCERHGQVEVPSNRETLSGGTLGLLVRYGAGQRATRTVRMVRGAGHELRTSPNRFRGLAVLVPQRAKRLLLIWFPVGACGDDANAPLICALAEVDGSALGHATRGGD